MRRYISEFARLAGFPVRGKRGIRVSYCIWRGSFLLVLSDDASGEKLAAEKPIARCALNGFPTGLAAPSQEVTTRH